MREVLKNVTMLAPEQEAIRARCFHPSGFFTEFSKAELERTVPARFEDIVRKHPQRIALKFGTLKLTYNQLNKTANRLAHIIFSRCNHEEETVALLFDQGTDAIAAILGVLKAGKIYVPLDPAHPVERLSGIIRDSQAVLLITNTKNETLAHEIAPGKSNIVIIDNIDALVSDNDPGLPFSPDRLAYVLYTSGSTGRPKGVAHNHRNVLHDCMSYTNNLHICGADRIGLLASICVGASMHFIFAALLNGATLYPFDLRQKGTGYLADWLTNEKINLFQLSANVFRHFLDTLTSAEAFPDVRLVALGSSYVTKQDVDRFKKYFPENCILLNRLSSTESRTIRWNFIDRQTQIDGEIVPVGYPVEDKEIFLVDETGARLGPNEIGEIVVKSRYLATGYWRRDDFTRAKFMFDAENSGTRTYLTGDLGRMASDGCLEHLGRKDGRVKIRGYTVEPAEIETALLDHENIRETAVIGREDEAGDKRLVACLVVHQQPAPASSDLREFLSRKLPFFMIPSKFVFFDMLPITASGKVDRISLVEQTQNRSEDMIVCMGPRTPVEEMVTAIWSGALGFKQLSVNHNFFDLGGHSLIATKILKEISELFQVNLELRDLFDNPTIEELALTITDQMAKDSGLLTLESL
jgi:amino acid adenylation domain-containing protein